MSRIPVTTYNAYPMGQPARVIQSPSATTASSLGSSLTTVGAPVPAAKMGSPTPVTSMAASAKASPPITRSPMPAPSPSATAPLAAAAKAPTAVAAKAPMVISGANSLASSTGMRQAKVISSGGPAMATSPQVVKPANFVSSGLEAKPANVVSGGLEARPATVSATTKPNTTAGPEYTQNAYEVKHKDDAQLTSLKELRKTSGLKSIPVNDALQALKTASEDGSQLTRETFIKAYKVLLKDFQQEIPSDDVVNAVFDLFDRDDNNVVDMMEVICGVSLLCTGTEEDKIHAVFDVFDENGDGVITMDEMFKFLSSVFKVVLTPNVMAVMNSMGVSVESAEDLASVTALECFKTADLNQDGKLSVSEFKNWFYAPRNDPSFLFSPVRKLLQ